LAVGARFEETPRSGGRYFSWSWSRGTSRCTSRSTTWPILIVSGLGPSSHKWSHHRRGSADRPTALLIESVCRPTPQTQQDVPSHAPIAPPHLSLPFSTRAPPAGSSTKHLQSSVFAFFYAHFARIASSVGSVKNFPSWLSKYSVKLRQKMVSKARNTDKISGGKEKTAKVG
jgi:hypothetical protein